MKELTKMKMPSKGERKIAMESYNALAAVLQDIQIANPEIEIEEIQDRIVIPLPALKLLAKVLKAMGEGKVISVVPIATEMTTQAAAEQLGCSRPHLVKLLESGEIPYTKIGRHRRVKLEDLLNYKATMKAKQEQLLIEMMDADEESGLYDS